MLNERKNLIENPNIEINEGRVIMWQRHSRDEGQQPKVVFDLPWQCVIDDGNGRLRLLRENGIQEIFSIAREEVIATLASTSSIEEICDGSKTKGYLVKNPGEDVVFNQNWKAKYSIPVEKGRLRITQILGLDKKFIEEILVDGGSRKLICLDTFRELPLNPNSKMVILEFEDEPLIMVEEKGKVIGYTMELRQIAEYNPNYKMEAYNRHENDMKNRLPEYFGVKTERIPVGEGEFISHHSLPGVEKGWKSYDKIYLKEDEKLFGILRGMEHEVDIYQYEGDSAECLKVQLVGTLKQLNSSMIPMLGLRNN